MNRLLLLEDDESLIDGLVYALEKQGFFLSVARSLLEGKRKLKGEKAFDLLLFDVTLPDGSAFELCETLRREENFTPIIFLTASDEETSIIRGLDCGGDDYIQNLLNWENCVHASGHFCAEHPVWRKSKGRFRFFLPGL